MNNKQRARRQKPDSSLETKDLAIPDNYPLYLNDLPISPELKVKTAEVLEEAGWGDPIAKYKSLKGQVQVPLMTIYFQVVGKKSTDLVTAIQKYVHANS